MKITRAVEKHWVLFRDNQYSQEMPAEVETELKTAFFLGAASLMKIENEIQAKPPEQRDECFSLIVNEVAEYMIDTLISREGGPKH